MGQTFKSIWSEQLKNIVHNLAISSDGNLVVASSGRSFSVFDADGNLRVEEPTAGDCLAVSISDYGTIVASSSFGGVVLYSRYGQLLHELFDERATSVSISGDGSHVVAALTAEDMVLLFPTNGDPLLWSYQCKEPTAVATNRDGSMVAIGGANGDIWLVDSQGVMQRHFSAEGCLYGLALDPTGSYLAATPANRSELYFFSTDGVTEWSKTLSAPSLRVAITDGGQMVACADGERLRLYAQDGAELTSRNWGVPIFALAMTNDGSRVVTSSSRTIHYLETSLRFDSTNNSDVVSERLISEIRTRYLDSPADGLCRWFNNFDRCLRQQMYVTCDALLAEIEAGGYELDAAESEYVESRRGALALSRGITHELKKEFDEATKCYHIALEAHKACQNREGEGQVRVLLGKIEETSERELLAREFQEQLKILGSGEACLTRRIERASTAELLNVIYSAKEAGHIEPLFAALSKNGDHFSGAANASAAFAYLHPGADLSTLLGYFNHPNWFVRWRVCGLVLRYQLQHGPTAEIREALMAALARETDPDVRRELLSLVTYDADFELTEAILPFLTDSDPEVRFSACKTLGEFGKRNSLLALQDVEEGQTFFGESVTEAAVEAIESIKFRDPALIIDKVVFFGSDSYLEDERRLFLPREPVIEARIQVNNFHPGLYFCLKQDAYDKTEFILSFSSYRDVDQSDDSEAWFEVGSDPEKLLEYEPDVYRGDHLRLRLLQPPNGWLAGENSLVIELDGEEIGEYGFEIVDFVSLEHCVLSSAINNAHVVINPSTVFAANSPQMYCQVVIDEAPAGLKVEANVCDDQKNLVRRVREVIFREGKQRVLLQWDASTLKAGMYTVEINAEDLDYYECDFQVVDGVTVTDANLYRADEWLEAVALPVYSYHPHEDIVASVTLSPAPQGLTVSGQLAWRGEPVFSDSLYCTTRSSGEQDVTFLYHRPATGWPTGPYRISIFADDLPIHNIDFQVRPVPLSTRIREFTSEANELVKHHGESIGKSAVEWGLKLPAIGLVLFLMDVLLGALIGPELVTSTLLLWIGHKLGAISLASWIIIGLVLGALHAVGKNFWSERFHELSTIVLTLVTQSLIWFQATYVIFSPGYLWPAAYGGVFSKILYAAPIVAWLGVVVAYRLNKQEQPYRKKFFILAVETGLLVILGLLLYLYGLVSSLLLGTTAWLVFSIFNSSLASSAWSVGGTAGFAIGLLALFVYGRIQQRRKRSTN